MASGDETRQLRELIAERVIRSLHVSGEDLEGRAARIAPKEEGTLRASGTVTLIVNGVRFEGAGALGAAIAAAKRIVGAGGNLEADVEVAFNTIYAAIQHEELSFHHDVGQAKYLETPFRSQLSRYQRLLDEAVNV